MCFDYDYTYEFCNTKIVTARKVHKCTECVGYIAAGMRYYYIFAGGDGEIYFARMCRECFYDFCRVIALELAAGCRWSEAIPPSRDHVIEHLAQHDLLRTIDEVPEWFDMSKDVREAVKSIETRMFESVSDT